MAERPKRRLIRPRVKEVERLTPQMIRVVVGGDELEGFGAGEFTDHYVKLQIPPPGASYRAPFESRSSVRGSRARSGRARAPTPCARGTRSGRADDRLRPSRRHRGRRALGGRRAARRRAPATGPGGAYTPDPAADWHLMVGDASVIPAISASLARIPAGKPVHVLLDVEGPEEEQALETPGDLRLHWLHANGRAREEAVLAALAELEFPAGAVHAFVHGEASSVRAVRRHLLVDRGVPREALSVSGYWKRARTEEGWREDKPEWNRAVEQDAA